MTALRLRPRRRQTRGALLWAGLGITACLCLGCTGGGIEQAQELLQDGDYLAAREIYLHQVERRPDDFAAQYGLGMTWCAEAIYKSELGLAEPYDWYPAIYHVSRAQSLGGGSELRPTLAILHFNLGAHYRKLNDNPAAVERLEQAISYDSTLLKALNLLGAICHETGDLDKAEQCYMRTVALKPDYGLAHFNLGAVAWARGDFAGASRWFEQALSVEPGNEYYKLWLGKAQKRAAGG